MSQNLQNFGKLQKNQLDYLVDFEKCCTTRIFLQKSVPIQSKTSNILPKFGIEFRPRPGSGEADRDPSGDDEGSRAGLGKKPSSRLAIPIGFLPNLAEI